MGNKYELRADDALRGKLEFRSIWGTLAWAESGQYAFSFKRLGFLNPRVSVRLRNSENDYAMYHPKFFGGGRLELPDGSTHLWEPINFWRTKWRFCDSSGFPELNFEQGAENFKLKDIFKLQAYVDFKRISFTEETAFLLASFGFYLMVLNQMDSSAAAAAAASS